MFLPRMFGQPPKRKRSPDKQERAARKEDAAKYSGDQRSRPALAGVSDKNNNQNPGHHGYSNKTNQKNGSPSFYSRIRWHSFQYSFVA
jgi:hypothetical protein